MKIIHTSDWHIGQTLYQYSRDEEHRYFFNRLKEIIEEEKPDALLISGDIFHSPIPNVISQRLYYQTLVDISRLYDDLQIIVIAGNHDSPSRLEAPRELWKAFNVTVVGNIDFYKKSNEHNLEYDASKIEIPITRNNEIIGWVLAVPFINAGNYPSLKENDNYSNRVFSFYQNLCNNLIEHELYKEEHAVAAMGHLMLDYDRLKNHDKIIGGIESVNSEKISSLSKIDYWAFGHVHHHQNINSNANMRYSGSPFALTFNEIYPHSVTVADIENHNLEVRIKGIEPLIPIIDFPSKPKSYDDALPIDTVINQLNTIIDNESYVRLHVRSEEPLSDVTNAKILNYFKDKKAKYCGIQVYLPSIEAQEGSRQIRTIEEFKSISPFELGCSVFKRKNNMEMPEQMKEMFKKVCDEVINQ